MIKCSRRLQLRPLQTSYVVGWYVLFTLFPYPRKTNIATHCNIQTGLACINILVDLISTPKLFCVLYQSGNACIFKLTTVYILYSPCGFICGLVQNTCYVVFWVPYEDRVSIFPIWELRINPLFISRELLIKIFLATQFKTILDNING